VTRDRIVGLLVAAATLALGVWIAFHTYWADDKVSTPLRGQAARNPYYSVERVVHALGMETRSVASLRALPSTADVLLVDDLHDDAAHHGAGALEHWVESGGRLVVTSSTLWANAGLQSWTGIGPSHHDPKPATAQTPQDRLVLSIPGHGQDCAPMTAEAAGTPTGEMLHVCSTVPGFWFGYSSKRVPEWSLRHDDDLQLLRLRMGNGSVTVIGPAGLLAPRLLLRQDNAQAFIEAAQLKRGDHLSLFSPARDESLLRLLWRVAAPAIVCFALALLLILLRQWPRFGPLAPAPVAARRSLAEQIRANARFAWRTGKLGSLRQAVLRALDRTGRREIAGYDRLNPRQRASEFARRARVDPTALRAAMTADAAGGPEVQRAAIALLEHTRRLLNARPDRKGTL
jgi:hypothetical protein